MRIVVIGGIAAGMSVASLAKRRMPGAKVIALECGDYFSYGTCGISYNIEDPQRDILDLVVITPAEFRHTHGIDVRIRHEVLSIHAAQWEVEVRDLVACRNYRQDYDRLVMATGAQAVRPLIPGIDLPGVYLLRDFADGDAIKRFIDAAGDCAEAFHRPLAGPVCVPLGTTANKQVKVAGANAAGDDGHFAGIAGTAGFRVFDLEVARAGVGAAEISSHGLDAISVISRHSNRGDRFPGAGRIATVAFAERKSGRLLGAQTVGADTAAKRVDIFATALHARMSVSDVESLDFSNAPPFAPVYDPVLIAAGVARQALSGCH